MIYFFILIFFFGYSFLLFFIENINLLIIFAVFNILISLILKVSLKKHLKCLVSNILLVAFVFTCNLFFDDLKESLKVSIRLFLIIDYTYLMGCFFNPTKIRTGFKYFFYPLKIFKVDIDNLTLIIAISLAFIPVLSDEVKMIKFALKSKGLEFNLKNILRRPHIYLITFFNNLFDRVDELEKSIIMKGYNI